MEKLNEKKTHAAHLLSDEIYETFRSAQFANRLLSNVLDFRMDDEEIDLVDQYTLRATFKEITWRLDIMSGYMSEVVCNLRQLDTAACSEFVNSDDHAPASDSKLEQAQEFVRTLSQLTPGQKNTVVELLCALATDCEPEWPQEYLSWKAAKEKNSNKNEEVAAGMPK